MHNDQSNKSVVGFSLFDHLGVTGEATSCYLPTTCAGCVQTYGRRAFVLRNLFVEYLDKSHSFEMPPITEFNDIPVDRLKILTLEMQLHIHISRGKSD